MVRQLALRAAPPLGQPEDADNQERPARRRIVAGGVPRRAFHAVPVTTPGGALLAVVWQSRRGRRVIAEGVVLPDDATSRQWRTANRWAGRNPSRASRPANPADAATHVEGQARWANGHLWRLGAKRQRSRDGRPRPAPELYVWDAGPSLAALARNPPNGSRAFTSGRNPRAFSLLLFGRGGTGRRWEEAAWQPRAIVEQVAPHITFASWGSSVDGEEGQATALGRIVDPRHPVQALTGTLGPSFQDACQWFGVKHRPAPIGPRLTGRLLDRARARLDAEVELVRRLSERADAWRRGGVDVTLGSLFTANSLARRLISSTGRTPAASKCAGFSAEAYAASVGAFQGPHADARVLRWPTPVVVLDGPAEYGRMAARIGLDDLLCAVSIRAERRTPPEVEALLARVGLGALLDPVNGGALWRALARLVVMFRSDDAWLQHRWFTGTDVESATAPLHAPVLPVSALDLAGAIVHDGELRGTVHGGWETVCEGRLPTHDVRVPGTGVNVGADELFEGLLAVREELHAGRDPLGESCIKRLLNSAAFGMSAQEDRAPLRLPEWRGFVDPSGVPFEARVGWEGNFGEHTFFPAATAVTAAARLDLTIHERMWHDMGGTVLATHTDSMFLAAAPEPALWPCPGGEERTSEGEAAIRLLGWADVERLRERTASIGAAWKPQHHTMERPVHALVTGIGSYAIFDPVSREVVHNTENQLGGVVMDASGRGDARLRDGRRAWVAESIAEVVPAAFPGEVPLAPWATNMAVSAWRVSTPAMLAWRPGARPFEPFLLAHPGLAPVGVADAPTPGSPTAPFDPDPTRWAALPWVWRDGSAVTQLMSAKQNAQAIAPPPPGAFTYATVGDLVHRWRLGGSAGARPAEPGGRPSSGSGLYHPVATAATDDIVLIGRDGDRLHERAIGLLVDPAERLTVLTGRGDYVGSCRIEVLRAAVRGPLREAITRRSRVAQRTVRVFLAGADTPRMSRRLAEAAAAEAADLLVAAGWPWEDVRNMPLGVRLAELERLGPQPQPGTSTAGPIGASRCAYPGCGRPPVPRSDACAAHRTAMQRQRNRARRRDAGDGGSEGGKGAP
jgi:hypothetical protein